MYAWNINIDSRRPAACPTLCRTFDFDGDERWKSYVMNLEIPPGRDKNAVIEKFKAKWYKREIVSAHMTATLRSETAAKLELPRVVSS